MEPHELVAAEVRAGLARKQLSGVRAAKALGWTQNYLSVRLRGEVEFGVTDLLKIADLLEVPVSTFFESPKGVISLVGRGLMFDKTSPAAGLRISATCERREHFACAEARCACWCHDRIGSVPVNLYRSLLGLAA